MYTESNSFYVKTYLVMIQILRLTGLLSASNAIKTNEIRHLDLMERIF